MAKTKRPAKKAPVKKAAPTKAKKKPTKKVAPKAAPKKVAPKKAAPKKAAAKKAAPAKKPAKKAAAKKPAAKKPAPKKPAAPFELVDLRRPLEHLGHTTDYERDQMTVFIMGITPEAAVFVDAWHPVELMDVAIGKNVVFQLYLHPAGGYLFDHATTGVAASATKPSATAPYAWVGSPKDAALQGVLEAAMDLTRDRPTYIDKPTGTPPPIAPKPIIAATPAMTSHPNAASAYASAVAATSVAQDSERAVAAAAAAVAPGTGLRLVNHRLPLERIDRTTPEERAQIETLMAQEKMGPLEEAHENEEIHPFELVDVVDVASGQVRYQVYLWPFGSGAIFEAASTKNIANICQHHWDQNPVDEELRTKLAAAWNEAEVLGIQQTVIWK